LVSRRCSVALCLACPNARHRRKTIAQERNLFQQLLPKASADPASVARLRRIAPPATALLYAEACRALL
jgi:hypothetical protein